MPGLRALPVTAALLCTLLALLSLSTVRAQPSCSPYPIYVRNKCRYAVTVSVWARLGEPAAPGTCLNGTGAAGEWCMPGMTLLATNLTVGPLITTSNNRFYYYANFTVNGDNVYWNANTDTEERRWLDRRTGGFCNSDGSEGETDTCKLFGVRYTTVSNDTCYQGGNFTLNLNCSNYAEAVQGVRLAGGSNATSGRLEVQLVQGGPWGTVCSDRFDDRAASVACRQLGFPGGGWERTGFFGPGSEATPISLSNVECNGAEASLADCTYTTTEFACSHDKDAGVVCDAQGPPPSPSPPPPPPPPPAPAPSSLSAGAIAGIAVGALLTVGLTALGGFLWWRRSRRRAAEPDLHLESAGWPHTDPSSPSHKPADAPPALPPQDSAFSSGQARAPGLPGSLPANGSSAGNSLVSGSASVGWAAGPLVDTLISNSSSRSGGHLRLPTPEAAADPLLSFLNSQVSAGSQGSGSIFRPPRQTSGGVDTQPWAVTYKDIQFLNIIGEGSFGKVYRAIWHQTEVACKLLLDPASSAHQEDSQRMLTLSQPVLEKLEAEASLLASLRHPNIVSFYGICREPPCFLTDYCSRGSLNQLLRAGLVDPAVAAQLTWQRRVGMALDAALGMLYLHSRVPAIVHRDLKSPNLLVTASYRIKVADFNLSRVLDEAAKSSSLANMNPRWLAPEVMLGGRPTKEADVFSFACVMWELLVWSIPWGPANPWHLVGTITAGNRLELPSPEQLPGPDTAQHLREVARFVALVRRCWAQAPAERPAFSEIVTELRELQGDAS